MSSRAANRYTAMTSGFLHSDLPHLIFNMITFWYFGVPLERVIGTPLFSLLYLAGLVLSLSFRCPSIATTRHTPRWVPPARFRPSCLPRSSIFPPRP